MRELLLEQAQLDLGMRKILSRARTANHSHLKSGVLAKVPTTSKNISINIQKKLLWSHTSVHPKNT